MSDNAIKILDLFSGIGGFALAADAAASAAAERKAQADIVRKIVPNPWRN